MTPRLAVAALVAALVAAAPRPAHAQQDDARVGEARAHFEAGVRLLESGRVADAVGEFERSVALRESPVAVYNLGLAYRSTGAHRRAIATLSRFLTLARNEAELRDAQGLIRESAAALVHVQLRVTGGATEVQIDGEPVSVALDAGPREIELDPGSHVFEARRPGYEPDVRRVQFAPGARGEVALVVATPRSGPLAVRRTDARTRVARALAPQTQPARQPARGAPWVWVGVGAGVAALVAGALLVWAPWDTGPHGTWATTQALGARP